jgi:alpha-tubulin suppressor-like RCC1 family protein
VVNSNGGTGIRVNGLTTSSFPAWSTGATLSNQTANTSFAVNLSATSDSNITYANTSALPAGTTLAANGRFSGTVTIGTQTTYTFDVKATDVENQDATRTFSLTVTIILNFLYSTGWNQFGILGQNVSINRSSPVQIGTDAWNTVSSSFTHTLAVAKNNWLWGWGDAGFSQLGAYTTGSQSNPVLISTSSWKTVAAGRRTSAGIRTNGTLWTWGAGSYGRLGSNSENGRNINSGQVGALTNWNFVACHQYGMVATRTDGTLWAWGRNQNGQLGDNSRINRSSPVQIAGSTWLQPTAGQIATVVRTTDGAVWGWGYIQSFGNAAGTSRSSPGQIGAGITWTNVSMHSEGGHLLALDSLNRAWAGGIGNYGATGQNNTTSNQQIGVNQIAGTWLSLSAGAYGGVGVKDNGSLWAWGRNGRGAVGNNAVADVSSPVQIGSSTNWTAAFGGNETIFAIN